MKMGTFNLVDLKKKHSEWLMKSNGLQPKLVVLDNGAKMHCWAPIDDESKTGQPILVLIHGFGAEGAIAWEAQVKALSSKFRLYIPDLPCFGSSTPPIRSKNDHIDERSEVFQAVCVYKTLCKLMEQSTTCGGISLAESCPHGPTSMLQECPQGGKLMEEKCQHGSIPLDGDTRTQLKPLDVPIHVLGHSYGGFVAYRMAHIYPNFVSSLIIVSSGIMMTPRTNDALLSATSCESIEQLLVPPSPSFFKIGLSVVFNDYRWILSRIPDFVYHYLHQKMLGDKEGKLELLDGIIIGKENAPPLPTIEQDVCIIWGEKDEIFNISLGHQLKEFLGNKAKLSIIKDVGHVPQIVKPRAFNDLLISYLETFNKETTSLLQVNS